MNFSKNITKAFAIMFFFTLFSCEESDLLNFTITDDFESDIVLTGLADEPDFSANGNTIDLSGLLEDSEKLKNLKISSVSITLLDDYSETEINGTMSVTINETSIFNNTPIDLEVGVPFVINDISTIDILNTLTNLNTFQYNVSGALDDNQTLDDDNFTIKVSFEVKAKVGLIE
jgi:hypothetical protein